MKRKILLLVLTASLMLAACVPAGATPIPAAKAPDGPLNITVSILPQEYFVERIGGEYVKVNVTVEPGANPATYEPKPGQMVALANASEYFSIGVPFEDAWLQKNQAANLKMKMVDTTQGIERIATDDGGFDPHIWLSPALVKIQSQTIYNTLAGLDPAHKDQFKANLEAFLADIDQCGYPNPRHN